MLISDKDSLRAGILRDVKREITLKIEKENQEVSELNDSFSSPNSTMSCGSMAVITRDEEEVKELQSLLEDDKKLAKFIVGLFK